MSKDNNLDEFDELGDYKGPEEEQGWRAYSSIFTKIFIVVVAYFLIVNVIDPMTPNINESEIIYEFGSYPYDKVAGLFRDDPTDSDDDGLADKEETKGWELESKVLSLSSGDVTQYDFHLAHSGSYSINMSILSENTSKVSWGWGALQHSTELNAVEWTYITLDANHTDLTVGDHTLSIQVIFGNISIDWISLVDPEYEYAVALDGVNTIYTSGISTVMTVHVHTDPDNPDTDYDGMLDGYEVATGERIGGWQDPLVTNNRFALLLAGGSTDQTENYPSIRNNIEYAYEVLHDFYGYSGANIQVLSWDGQIQNLDIIDAPGSLEEIGKAFHNLENEMGPNDFLFVFISSHGLPGNVEVYKTDDVHDNFMYSWLMENITSLNEKTGVKRIAVVVDACNSGSCIYQVSGENIVTISSTEPEDDSYTHDEGYALFTYFFFQALEHPNLASLPSYERVKNAELTFEEHIFISLGEAYTISKDKLKIQRIAGRVQIPQIDQNGDNEPDVNDDEGLAYLTYI